MDTLGVINLNFKSQNIRWQLFIGWQNYLVSYSGPINDAAVVFVYFSSIVVEEFIEKNACISLDKFFCYSYLFEKAIYFIFWRFDLYLYQLRGLYCWYFDDRSVEHLLTSKSREKWFRAEYATNRNS